MAINPDWLAKAEGNRDYHQGGMRCYFLILCFISFFPKKPSSWKDLLTKEVLRGRAVSLASRPFPALWPI